MRRESEISRKIPQQIRTLTEYKNTEKGMSFVEVGWLGTYPYHITNDL